MTNKITTYVIDLFNKLVKSSSKVYTKKKNKELLKYLELRKEKVKKENINLTPYIGTDKCRTCGTVGKEHPETAYCFICDTDNW